MVTSSIEDNSNNRPKRAKIDTETRNSRIKEVEEGIRDIDEEISFKEKRRAQAETLRDYRQCDEITERLSSLREKKRVLSRELVLLQKKELQSKWYRKNKSKKINKSSLETSSSSSSGSSDSNTSLFMGDSTGPRPPCSSRSSTPQPHDIVDLSQSDIHDESETPDQLSVHKDPSECRAEDSTTCTDVSQDSTTDVNPDNTTDVNLDNTTDVNPDNTTDVNLDITTDVNRDSTTDVSQDSTTDVNLDNTTDVNPNNTTDVNLDNTTDVNRDNTTDVNQDDTTDVNQVFRECLLSSQQ